MTSPIAGPSAATNGGQGALGGFEALLAAFFGPTDQTAAGAAAASGLFAPTTDAATAETPDGELIPAGEAESEAPTTAAAPDAMTMAALLIAPQVVPQPQPQAPIAAGGEVSGEPPAPTPAPAAGFAPQMAADAAPVSVSKPLSDTALATASQAAEVPTAAAETLAAVTPQAKPALAAEPQAKPKPNGPAAPAPQTQTAQPTPAPQAAAAAAATDAPQAQLAQAEAAAPAIADEVKPQEPQQAARPARHADADRRRGGFGQAVAPPPAADGVVTPNAVTAAAGAGDAGKAAAALETDLAPPAPKDAKSEPAAAADAPDVQLPAHAAPAAHAHVGGQAAPGRAATSETIANLTAQISKKLEGRATKFDVELTPAGLGHVSVSVEIAASGKMTAAMSFDSPQAAAEVRARSHELQRALEQAGFDLAGGLSFDVNGERGNDGRGLAQQQQHNDGASRGRAFQAVLGTAGEAAETAASAALQYARRSATGVDIRI
ncbi:MAG: flagellar hook-length control protein FliK [Phenylobacterium sp.]|nr:flagellar hook-length control protein FliK [Phenylobacterium sp.]